MKIWGRVVWDGSIMFKWERWIHRWEKNELTHIERRKNVKEDLKKNYFNRVIKKKSNWGSNRVWFQIN